MMQISNINITQEATNPPQHSIKLTTLLLLAILSIAGILRLARLDQHSLWYDELVSVRLARTANPSALLELLEQIDATRAPLHPLLLQVWIKVFGPSDVAVRGFSACCGIATVALIFGIGRSAFDAKTGLWAAWLCAWSPLMVMYAREARMYAWVVMVTSICWWLLFSFRDSTTFTRRLLYVGGLIALALSHPLGILMALALGLAAFLDRTAYHFTIKGWLFWHGMAALIVAPWLPHYLDHAPSYIIGQLPLRFLLGLPIGFVGGDFRVLAVCSLVIAHGLWRDFQRGKERAGEDVIPLDSHRSRVPILRSLLVWFVASPLLLYAYSRAAHPVFGPARYTLYVGPAYLLLLARGLVVLPWIVRLAGVGTLLILAISLLKTLVFDPGLKADWRSAAVYLNSHAPKATVVVLNARPDAAQYYLGPSHHIISMPKQAEDLPKLLEPGSSSVWYAQERQTGRELKELPDFLAGAPSTTVTRDFAGLRLIQRKE